MTRLYISIIAAALLTACGDSKKWTEGGTLHKARISEWKKADNENKMATVADMLVAIRQANGSSYGNTGELKIDAEKLVSCMEDKVKAGVADTSKVSAIAVECVVQFNARQ